MDDGSNTNGHRKAGGAQSVSERSPTTYLIETCADWSSVPPRPITGYDLAGRRVPLARTDGKEQARRRISELSADRDPRRNIRAIEKLSDGRVIAALDGVGLESWSPSGHRQWAVPDEAGGRAIVVAPDEGSAWIALQRKDIDDLARVSLADGGCLDELTPTGRASLVRCAGGLPAPAPAGSNGSRSRMRIRRGSRTYFMENIRGPESDVGPISDQFLAATLNTTPPDGRPREPSSTELTLRFPCSWTPNEIHFAGAGVETSDGDLVHTGTVYDGRGLQPGGSFVVRRRPTTGEPLWVFRTDRAAVDLDADSKTVYVAFRNGELVALDVDTGTALWRGRVIIGTVPVLLTALTVAGPGRLLLGTGDGRILECVDLDRSPDVVHSGDCGRR
ncbi:hypothetical protein [Nocardia aurea]|uniref:Pyrrolo-quinoline quinone repeat domain-containing protein n=1 Tax=Nocardia aurea TaxID=2144174 RepID=A0ABV3FTI5_9NOCA